MPTPFMCHWCDKPTMNETGICIECEQKYEEGNKDIAGTVRELESRVRWLEDGLKEIASGRDDMNGIYIKQQAQAVLDGEPTTADEHNKNFIQYRDTGDENDESKWIKNQETNAELLIKPTIKGEKNV